jgi:hypothetical protein
MEATPDPRLARAPLPIAVRSMGATLGVILGLAAMGLVYIASAIPVAESVLHIRYILGPDGIAATSGTRLLAWAVAPVAAGMAGWISAPRALVGRRFAGVRMGFWTYAIAIVVAPFLVFGPSLAGPGVIEGIERQPLESLQSIVTSGPFVVAMIIGFGAVILAPLLLVSAGAGAVWAAAVRWLTRGSGDPGLRADIPETDTRLLVVMAATLGLLWLVVTVVTLGSTVFSGGEFID